jgi:hypothetical protein
MPNKVVDLKLIEGLFEKMTIRQLGDVRKVLAKVVGRKRAISVKTRVQRN